MEAYFVQVPPHLAHQIPDSLPVVQAMVQQGLEEQEQTLNLGEAWAGLHYTLTSELPIPKDVAQGRGILWRDESRENIILGGHVTAMEASYGAVRYHAPEAVTRWANALTEISANQFAIWYDGPSLSANAIPPGDWETVTQRSWLVEQYDKLVKFYQDAAQLNSGLLLFIW